MLIQIFQNVGFTEAGSPSPLAIEAFAIPIVRWLEARRREPRKIKLGVLGCDQTLGG